MKQQMRTYQVATEKEPLKFRVQGPTIIRVDRREDGVVSHDYYAVDDVQSFSLSPSAGQRIVHTRVFQLASKHATSDSYRPEATASTDARPRRKRCRSSRL